MRRILHQWQGWNNPHLWLLLFCLGVIALRFFPQLPPLPLTIFAAVMIMAGAIWWAWLRPAAAFALGFCWACVIATMVFAATIPAELEKKDVIISGRVIGAPLAVSGYQRFDFVVEQLAWQGTAYPSPGAIRLKLYRDQPQILSGQHWTFTARLKKSRGYQNPGASFNYETYLFQRRLRATGYVRTQPMPVLLESQPVFSITAYRQRVANFIRTSLHSAERSGLVAALVVGIRNDMSARDWEVLLRTGTIHLVAISGLHIGLVAGLALLFGACCWRFAGRLPLVVPAPKVGVIVGLLAGLVYAFLAGMTIPTQRAVCMLVVVVAAVFFHRRPFGYETLIMALTVVLLVDPLAPLAGGFWLSFGAVTILIIGATRGQRAHFNISNDTPSATIRSTSTELVLTANALQPISQPMSQPTKLTSLAQRMKIPCKISNSLRPIFARFSMWTNIQLMLFIGMAPLLLVLFQRVSLAAPLANLVAIPIIGLLAVPVALFGLLLYTIGLESAAVWAFQLSLWVINQLWVLLEWFSSSTWSVWQQPSPPVWSLPLAVVGALLLLSPSILPLRWIGLLWLLPMFSVTPVNLANGEFNYHLLEVGNGLASVVKTRNHLLVYDAGPRREGGLDAGETVVVPFLQQLNAKAIDTFIVSHGDNDHIGGQRAVSKSILTHRLLTSVPQKISGAQKCYAGQTWVWDEVRFQILWPLRQSDKKGNDASCVLKVSSEFGSLLLTGDIGKPAEIVLAKSAAVLNADVLQAPHHGSKTSSTETFLHRVQPLVAVASIGYLNRYKHPHKIVTDRYARRQIPFYTTTAEGAIHTSFSASGITLKSHRGTHPKYWLQPAHQLTTPITFLTKFPSAAQSIERADKDDLSYTSEYEKYHKAVQY